MTTRHAARWLVVAALTAAAGFAVLRAQSPLPVLTADAIQPGMVGTGRTVFAGDTQEEFKATILGVVKNVMGPKRDLIVARLEGGPLANTGVIAGMSGSPVYIDGKLIGAVSYALGSFPKEPIAGITPITEMIDAVDSGGARPTGAKLDVHWPASADEVYAAIGRLVTRVTSPVADGSRVDGRLVPSPLDAVVAGLRPIGAAMVLGGFDPDVARPLGRALDARVLDSADQGTSTASASPFKPGDPIGVSLIHGDLDVGATGTVTAVNGSRVYAFGHPFLQIGPAALPMTRASILGILPSLDNSLKIATMGPIVGTITQDRSTAIGGTVGPPPHELKITLTMTSDRAAERHFTFYVVQDPLLTPLFTFTAVLNALTAYERQAGAMSIGVNGSLSLGADGQIAIDDVFSGDTALPSAATASILPMALVMANDFKSVTPDTLDLRLTTSEAQDGSTIERAWLDTTTPHAGSTVHVQVLLRRFHGGSETVSVPVTIPTAATGSLSILVSDAPTLAALEQHELSPTRPDSLAGTLTQLNTLRRNNRLYVRLLATSGGVVLGGTTLPSLPTSVQSALDTDKSVATAPIARAVVGAWEQRFDRVIKGSRELPLTIVSR
jgi:hypothetical protein